MENKDAICSHPMEVSTPAIPFLSVISIGINQLWKGISLYFHTCTYSTFIKFTTLLFYAPSPFFLIVVSRHHALCTCTHTHTHTHM
jgi:hypothetical protein